jgi:hypothetical protein
MVNLNFRWTAAEEAKPNKKQAKELLEMDWVFAADFLTDVIYEAELLYKENFKKKR